MSGTNYATTPLLGIGLNMTWGPTAGGPVPPATGPQFPTDQMQYGMTPGVVVRGHAAGHRFMLVQNGATALAANAAVNIPTTPPLIVGGTGGTAGTATVAVPANAYFWADIGL